jgi:secreted trypsin-like serine protease
LIAADSFITRVAALTQESIMKSTHLALSFSKLALNLVVFAGLAGCSTDDGDADTSNDDIEALESDIVGGRQDSVRDNVVYVDLIDKAGDHWACTGTVVAPTKVLTAAHCFGDIKAVRVVFGDSQARSSMARLSSTQAIRPISMVLRTSQ